MEKSVHKLSNLSRRILGERNIRTIVEIGAKDCTETVGLAEEFPDARIYTFECNPATLPLCRAKIASHSNITLIEKAVSDHDGEVLFFPIDQEKTKTPWADGNPGASSLFLASGKYKKEKYVQNEITVQSVSLNSFMNTKGIAGIDLLWMDIQGAELMALKGAKERLADIAVIHLEVEFMEIYRGQPLFLNIKEFLNECGFSLYAFTNFGKYFGDAVFINNDIFKKNKLLRDSILYPFYKYFWAYLLFVWRFPQKLKKNSLLR